MKKPNYYNEEMYADPTYYYAVTNIMKKQKLYKYRPIIYICSPLKGEIKENIKNARKYSRYAVKKGYLPIAPHLLFTQFMNDDNKDEREIAMHMGMVLLSKCKEIWVFGEKITEGMKREIMKAKRNKITIKYYTTECKEKVK